MKAIEVGKDIYAHPQVMSGTPCIRGRRLPSDMIAGMFLAGDSVSHIAQSYGLPESFVGQAIRYEYGRRKGREPQMRAITRGNRAVLVTEKEAQARWKEQP